MSNLTSHTATFRPLSPTIMGALLSLTLLLSVLASPAHATNAGAEQPPPPATAADTPVGFGRHATGGTAPVVVTSTASFGPGTLHDALSASGRHITFAVSGEIHAPHKLQVPSNTTIDGIGQDVVLTGRPLVLDGVQNVIVRRLTRRQTIGSNDDGVQVINGTTDVWLDHLTFTDIHDESIEVSQGATDVTISWVRIYDQNRGILVGNMPNHETGQHFSRVTLHHSWFSNVKQRQPRAVRWAHLHAYNNVIEGWKRTAMSAAQQAQLLSEGNVLLRGRKGNGLLTRAGQGKKNDLEGFARSTGDLLLGGRVQLQVNDPGRVFVPDYDYDLVAADEALALSVRTLAGA